MHAGGYPQGSRHPSFLVFAGLGGHLFKAPMSGRARDHFRPPSAVLPPSRWIGCRNARTQCGASSALPVYSRSVALGSALRRPPQGGRRNGGGFSSWPLARLSAPSGAIRLQRSFRRKRSVAVLSSSGDLTRGGCCGQRAALSSSAGARPPGRRCAHEVCATRPRAGLRATTFQHLL